MAKWLATALNSKTLLSTPKTRVSTFSRKRNFPAKHKICRRRPFRLQLWTQYTFNYQRQAKELLISLYFFTSFYVSVDLNIDWDSTWWISYPVWMRISDSVPYNCPTRWRIFALTYNPYSSLQLQWITFQSHQYMDSYDWYDIYSAVCMLMIQR